IWLQFHSGWQPPDYVPCPWQSRRSLWGRRQPRNSVNSTWPRPYWPWWWPWHYKSGLIIPMTTLMGSEAPTTNGWGRFECPVLQQRHPKPCAIWPSRSLELRPWLVSGWSSGPNNGGYLPLGWRPLSQPGFTPAAKNPTATWDWAKSLSLSFSVW